MAKKRYTDGYMVYGCEDCLKGFKIYLEEGLEDHTTKNVKPVPFSIRCPFCGSENCNDRAFRKFPIHPPKRLSAVTPFFANIPSDPCGKPTHMSYAKPEFDVKPIPLEDEGNAKHE